MRVYFNGSFCNGKTAMRNWVSQHYGLKIIPEIVRTIFAEKELSNLGKVRADTSLLYELQLQIIERQLLEEQRIGDDYTACRSIDSVSFVVAFCAPWDVTRFLATDSYNKYLSWLKQGNVTTFLVRPSKELISDDDFRDTDWELSMELFGIVKTLLRTNDLSYTLIETTNMSERQSQVRSILGPPKEKDK